MNQVSVKQFLKLEYIEKTPSEILRSGIDVLIGVNESIAKALGRLQIKTVFDLSNSRIFRTAEQIAGSLDNEDSIIKIFGRVASEMVNDKYIDMQPRELAVQSIIVLEGIGEKNFDAVRNAIQLDTVRDLSIWPPFLAAKAIFNYVFDVDNARGEDPDAPEELLPVARSYWTEKRYIKKLFIDEDAIEEGTVSLNHPIDVVQGLTQSYFKKPMLGALLNFEQTWTPHGLSLGSLIYSLALAPGESTRIALIDWQRQEAARISESTEQQERLSNLLGQNSAISEIADGVTKEVQEGNSDTTTDSTSSSGGRSSGFLESFFSGGGSSGHATSSAHTVSVSSSSGQRDVAMETQQDIRRSTQQQAASVRSRRATAVKEVQQSESEAIRTRIITNYNHSHAMSIHYYEVIQIYKMSVKLALTDRLIFVPMQPLDFTSKIVLRRFRHILKAGARTTSELELIARYTGEVKLNNLSPQISVPVKSIYLDEDAVIEAIEVSGASLKKRWDVSELQLELHNGQIQKIDNPIKVQASTYRFKPDGLVMLKEIFRVGLIYKHLLDYEDRMFAQTSFELQIGNKQEIRRIYHHLPTTRTGEENNPVQKWLVAVEQDFYAEGFINVLAEDQDYFSNLVWSNLSENQIARLLSPYTFHNRPLLGSIDFPPLGIYGNCLVFKYRHEDDSKWHAWKKTHISALAEEEDFVSVPTGGVFAEAVPGRYNASEKIDLTRFWNWQDSPIPFGAPEIAPITADSRLSEDTTQTAGLEQPLVNIVQPSALPDPQGMSALSNALTASNVFRDMSGLAEGIASNSAALQTTGEAAVGQAKIASENFKAAVDAASKVAQSIIGVPPVGTKGGKSSTQFGGEINLAREIDEAAGLSGSQKTLNKRGSGGGISGAGESGASTGGKSGGMSYAERLLRNTADPGYAVNEAVEFTTGQFKGKGDSSETEESDGNNKEEEGGGAVNTQSGPYLRYYFHEPLRSVSMPEQFAKSEKMNYQESDVDGIKIFILTPCEIPIEELAIPMNDVAGVIADFNKLIPEETLHIKQVFIGNDDLNGGYGAFRIIDGKPVICLPNEAEKLTNIEELVAHEAAHGLLDGLSALSSGITERAEVFVNTDGNQSPVLIMNMPFDDEDAVNIRRRAARFNEIYDGFFTKDDGALKQEDRNTIKKLLKDDDPFSSVEEFFACMISTYYIKEEKLREKIEKILNGYPEDIILLGSSLIAMLEGYLKGWTPDITTRAGLDNYEDKKIISLCSNYSKDYMIGYMDSGEALWAYVSEMVRDYGVFLDPLHAGFINQPCDLIYQTVNLSNIRKGAKVMRWFHSGDEIGNRIFTVENWSKAGDNNNFKVIVRYIDADITDEFKMTELLLLT